ncbi:efflux RND transporter periplasmic adaptor subunit [bacterium]|nr:efflux RND transporter periplasmic adaptor subunit [bacterium]
MKSTLKTILKNRWLPLMILFVGLVLSGVVAATGPEAPRRQQQRQARLVEVVPLEISDVRVAVEALGTVQPALGIQLQAQVAGQVVHVSSRLIPGGRFAEGDTLLRIDPREYEFAVRQRESDLARAAQALKLEESQQGIARREYELMGDVVNEGDAELVLRGPQLETARAAHDAAMAALEQARLNLERTAVLSPFNAIVGDRLVDRGGVVAANTAVAALIGTDACWVEVLVPVDDLKWIKTPRADGFGGSVVRVRQGAVWDDGVWREGRVLGSSGSLEAQGRMVRVIAEIPDPFSLRKANAAVPILLMDSLVDAEILGQTITGAVVIDRRYVHDGNTVWLMDGEDNLRIRTIEPVYTGQKHVFVTDGLEVGERLVTSYLSSPVEGMPLRAKGGTAMDDEAGGGIAKADAAATGEVGGGTVKGDAVEGVKSR